MATLPVVAVVGRPNVGKSTLVNRVLGKRAAVVEEAPGVTRDRREFTAEWTGRRFLLVDTGGWELTPDEAMSSAIREQAEAAVAGADVVVFVVDATAGVAPDDAGVAELLRRSDVPVVLAANKVDDSGKEALAAELWSLGLGEPHPVSALHGRASGELLDAVVARLPELSDQGEVEHQPRLAIVGRPNVGKSTLLNRLLGEERVIVAPRPGTTRDPIDVEIELGERWWRVVDTAGIRRVPKIKESADYFAVQRARKVLEEADVALLVMDALDGVTQQDQRLASDVAKAGVGLVILLNKWDALDEEQRELTERSIGDRLGFVGWAPLLRGAAISGARLHRIPAALEHAYLSRQRRVPTSILNRMVADWAQAQPPPMRKGRRAKLRYAVQAGIEPPTAVLFVSGGELADDYLRYLERRLREEVDLEGTPVRWVTRSKGEPRR
jgi:GTP-binding protein